MSEVQNIVSFIKDDDFQKMLMGSDDPAHFDDSIFHDEDTYLRKRSFFSGYDIEKATQLMCGIAMIEEQYQQQGLTEFIFFLCARSLTAGRDKVLEASDWLEMLKLDSIINAYGIHNWEEAELILDGQSRGDLLLYEEMESLGDYLQYLLDENAFPFIEKGSSPTSTQSAFHDELVAPLHRIIEFLAMAEGKGVDLMSDDLFDDDADFAGLLQKIREQ
jgi:hypothetical protein